MIYVGTKVIVFRDFVRSDHLAISKLTVLFHHHPRPPSHDGVMMGYDYFSDS